MVQVRNQSSCYNEEMGKELILCITFERTLALLKADSNCIGTKRKGQSKQKHLKVTQSNNEKKAG